MNFMKRFAVLFVLCLSLSTGLRVAILPIHFGASHEMVAARVALEGVGELKCLHVAEKCVSFVLPHPC
jgi:hypothetical protein